MPFEGWPWSVGPFLTVSLRSGARRTRKGSEKKVAEKESFKAKGLCSIETDGGGRKEARRDGRSQKHAEKKRQGESQGRGFAVHVCNMGPKGKREEGTEKNNEESLGGRYPWQPIKGGPSSFTPGSPFSQ